MGINRLKRSGNPAAREWSRDSPNLTAPCSVGCHPGDESGFTKNARLILELAKELDAIEHERRGGRIGSDELVDRLLSVWFAIKELDKTLNSPDSPE
jgi:hypothetical protein